MDDLKEEPYVEKCLMGRLVRIEMKWTGHVERMYEDRLPRVWIGLYRENAIAIQKESGDSNGGNV